MTHANYTKTLETLWNNACEKYSKGARGSDTFFNPEEEQFIKSIGATNQEIYDFAEDFVNYGEPDYGTFAILQDIRRAYFLEEQNGQPSQNTMDPATLPAKTDEVDGIVWLPRILPKARAKLRGELHHDTMFCCGGDRRFFRDNNIHPGEFLCIVWKNIDNDRAIIDWVKNRRSQLETKAA